MRVTDTEKAMIIAPVTKSAAVIHPTEVERI